MKKLRAAGHTVEVFAGAEEGPLVVLNTVDGEGEGVYEAVRAATRQSFALAAIGELDWNADLSPWPSEAVFRGTDAFSGCADEYLHRLTEQVLPPVVRELRFVPSEYIIAGYSLAGLFALYSLYRTSLFARAVSASGSLWYPGFMEYIRVHNPPEMPKSIYLSVGEGEARTRNSRMRTVEENTACIARTWQDLHVSVCYERNPGNHFHDPTGRMARGIVWTLAQME